MRFLILGAGGIGAYFGSRLVQADHGVTFVVRGDHGAALASRGLVLDHPQHPYAGPVDTVSGDALTAARVMNADYVLVCLKSTATAEAAHHLAALMPRREDPGGPLVVSLQNGVDNEAVLADILGARRVVGGLTRRIGAHIAAPGHVWATGPAETLLGRWPDDARCGPDAPSRASIEALAEALRGAAIPTEISPDIHRELWRKLVINNGVNALAALLGEETGPLLADPGLSELVHDLMAEAAAAARADGVLLDREAVDEMHRLISTFDSIKPSMLVDRERGREPEMDAICGAVIARCRAAGEDAPHTRTVVRLLRHALERDRR
ncbi:MAG: 2-dehydropantoate 2-reductase [Gammaproteobacteria bacterium]|nr:2-dehydropantoate 2-reductase [Gammaproteobacteria bacterium]